MEKLGFYNRGTKVRKDLAVLKADGVPAVLLEVGFISNKADNNLFDDKFNKIVAVIVKDIADVMNLKIKKKATVKVAKKFAVGDYNDYAIITATLNVRAGRGTEHEIMGVLAKNTKVKVLYIGEKKGTLWGSIDYGKNVGYISLNYAKPVE